MFLRSFTTLVATASQAVAASKAAGVAPLPAEASLDADVFKAAAIAAYTEAAKVRPRTAWIGLPPTAPTRAKIRWIGVSIQAISQQGLAAQSADPARNPRPPAMPLELHPAKP